MNATNDDASIHTVGAFLPSLHAIHDRQLQACVAHVWVQAMRTGNNGKGWTPEQLLALPMTLLAGPQPLKFLEHLNSCAEQCLAIAGVLEARFGDRVPINRDVLLAGALLADVGKLLEYQTHDNSVSQSGLGGLVRHPFTGVALAYAHALPPEVLHIIAAHSFEGDRVTRSIECIIFHHADFIDFDIARLLGSVANSAPSGSKP